MFSCKNFRGATTLDGTPCSSAYWPPWDTFYHVFTGACKRIWLRANSI